MNIRAPLAGLLFLFALSSCVFQQPEMATAIKKPSKNLIAEKKHLVKTTHDTLCIAAVGDIMLGTSYPNNSTLPPDSALHSFDAALTDLQQADITIGNLEGVLLDGGAPASFKMHLKSTAYLFRMPSVYSGIFKNAGFNLLSLANNHIGDFGDRGRLNTMRVLDSIGIAYAGQISRPDTVITISGVKYGFCSFAPNAQTLPITDLKFVKQEVRSLKSRCDVVIVSFHGGGEGPTFEHVPRQMETYMGARRGNVYEFAHTAINAGADLVLGNGPHVNRAVELYNGRLIAYSLGNFCTYKCVSVEGVSGLAPLLKVYLNKKGEFLSARIIPFKQTHADGLTRDSTFRVIDKIKQLTDADFPASGLTITLDGVITPLPQQVGVAAGIQ
ncbi:CapA family protein [Mucilaginibacter mali]|uniref:CapA family protein n=1 Tax=Mucilaginibacter mali TaxID=2740462 RepID=A0A7D4TSF9_9SPHI|nr:CapA family protein [Mucilaginibacter mali]QKJ32774.1 CapA family protein [Mucilaginibacter mali]